MDAPLSRYLARFETDGPDAGRTPPEPARSSPVSEPLVTLTANELDARQAHAADAAAATAAALAAARGEWAAGEGRAAAAGLDAVSALRASLVDKVADVLRPLMARTLAERACGALGVALDQILEDPDQPCLTVSGPADLLEAIRVARAATPGRPDAPAIAYVVTAGPDVTVAARATHVETRLGAALAALAAPYTAVDTETQP